MLITHTLIGTYIGLHTFTLGLSATLYADGVIRTSIGGGLTPALPEFMLPFRNRSINLI